MTSPTKHSAVADSVVFAGGAALAVLLFWSAYCFLAPNPNPASHSSDFTYPKSQPQAFDPNVSYTLDSKLSNWDEIRDLWLRSHPAFLAGAKSRILMITGSQPGPCRNPIGDHLLLRFFKNKADYCRLRGIDLFYNNALFHPSMPKFWAKIPVIRAAMAAHPEAEWIWWVDSDAAITDMEFDLPIGKYESHNLVVHGWPSLVYEKKSWVSLNAGVFLIRNCQWSLDFMDVWAGMGPQTPNYERWSEIQKKEFKDKLFPESDDQSGLVFLLLHEKEKWGDKIYLENEFYFEGYWAEIVGRLQGIAERYLDIERRSPELRRRKAEKDAAETNGPLREEYLKKAKAGFGKEGWRRPFITHFTGCQPCSGDHNAMYSGENCWDGMERALNFADDQVLRAYGFRHESAVGKNSAALRALPLDFPATS